ncbi:YcnI family protein [Streptomyces varsoviensis]|uniref:YcnI family copper-binding membrane protein n=1 Tax=Streptomyces varsoviensis TaxID=67373 RepID=UPI0033F83B4F
MTIADATHATPPPRTAHRAAPRRLALAAALAGGTVLLVAGPAAAHVSVQPGTAEKGGYTTVAFKVPNEKDNASTVKLEVTLDPKHPLPSVSTQPVPGWDVKVDKAKLDKPIKTADGMVNEAVTKITWTGGKIEPGSFQQFPVSMGPLPKDADQIVFKALQTYSDNDVVRWIDASTPGGEEPEHPAPALKLTAAAADKGGGDAKNDRSDTNATASSKSAAGGSDTTARVLGIVGIVVGVLGVAFAVLTGRRRSRT